ncbi:MAG TPA: arginine deiminase-related protein [Flavipsychrobacter sp.]|nr:arginine deiminase-related protein [Flavipsychrobacter sp.]
MLQGVFKNSPLPFSLSEISNRTEHDSVLLCTPDHFDIVDEKNVHMAGNIGSTNQVKVFEQWNALKSVYENLKHETGLQEISVLNGAEGCEDMVFCANQTFPWQKETGEKVVVMSKMRHASRQKEVQYFEDFFVSKGFTPLHFSSNISFEGMGDVIPHPHKRLLYGGYGHRTVASAYEELSQMLNVPVIALELVNPKFYHLDTCFVPLTESNVMLCKEAFSNEGINLLQHLFETIHFIPEEEAEKFFSLNAHVMDIDGKRTAILQKGSEVTKQVLEQEGYRIIELDTSEFMKSGGSVFCMKMMYP